MKKIALGCLGLLALAIILLVAFVLFMRFSEFGAIDSCLDGGGRWNDEAEICETEETVAPSDTA